MCSTILNPGCTGINMIDNVPVLMEFIFLWGEIANKYNNEQDSKNLMKHL